MFRNYYYSLLSNYISFFTKGFGDIASTSGLNQILLSKLDNKVTDYDNSALNCDFSYILAEGDIHRENCILTFLKNIHITCKADTRIIITYYSSLWKWPLAIATILGLRRKPTNENWVTHSDIDNFLLLADYEKIHLNHRILLPLYIPLLSNLVNKFLAPLPLFRNFCLVNILIARPINKKQELLSVSIVVAARNEEGNLVELVNRLPKLSNDDELIIIEGNSTDNTWELVQSLSSRFPDKNIKVAQQEGKGKGDAVRKGFSIATKDIFMILDADMTVPPEDLQMFYDAISSQKGEYINGSRLVYPMEKRAMRFINMCGNKFFAIAFSFVLGQTLRDTLCGTKVLSRKNYQVLANNRNFFGDFDPFGDFDLIFGASRMSLKFVEIPIRYKERLYGETNISRWQHGFLLLRMLKFATKKIKFI